MVACARREIVPDGEIGVFHCFARCVRRAFLCGFDEVTGNDYEHRRQWLIDLQAQAAGLFAVEIAFHAELSNHLHLIVRTRPDVVATWSDEEVVRRWLKIARLKRGSDLAGWEPSEQRVRMELAKPQRAATLRRRLSSVSWLMGTVCENLARRANAEDGCRGRFWETRFGCRELADETAILVCGIYVDLNQIRSGEASTPEQSRYTSAYDRIEGRKARRVASEPPGQRPAAAAARRDRWLCELSLEENADSDISAGQRSTSPWRASDKGLLPISLDDYLELLDWTGRQVRSDKPGAIPDHLAPILDRLHIHAEHWVQTVTQFESLFGHVAGRVEQITRAAHRLGRRWLHGAASAAKAFA
jgi:hypothetical protein